jgi:hypothetical protein
VLSRNVLPSSSGGEKKNLSWKQYVPPKRLKLEAVHSMETPEVGSTFHQNVWSWKQYFPWKRVNLEVVHFTKTPQVGSNTSHYNACSLMQYVPSRRLQVSTRLYGFTTQTAAFFVWIRNLTNLRSAFRPSLLVIWTLITFLCFIGMVGDIISYKITLTFINKQGEIAVWPRHHVLKVCREVVVGLHAFYNAAVDGGDRAASRYCRMKGRHE